MVVVPEPLPPVVGLGVWDPPPPPLPPPGAPGGAAPGGWALIEPTVRVKHTTTVCASRRLLDIFSVVLLLLLSWRVGWLLEDILLLCVVTFEASRFQEGLAQGSFFLLDSLTSFFEQMKKK